MSTKEDIKELFQKANKQDALLAKVLQILESVEKNQTSFEKKFSHHDEKEMAKYDKYDEHLVEVNSTMEVIKSKLDEYNNQVKEVIERNKETNQKIEIHKETTDKRLDKLEMDVSNGFTEIKGMFKTYTIIATVVLALVGGVWQGFTWLDEKHEKELEMLKKENINKNYSQEEQKAYYQMKLKLLEEKPNLQ